jgi:hypothetical protein
MLSPSSRSKFATVLRILRKQLQADRAILWLNGLMLLLFLALTVYVKFWSSGQVVETLFGSPFFREHPHLGMLTTVSNLLLCVSAVVCAFSFGLLRTVQPKGKANWFLFCSAAIITVILLDRMFRITIILYVFRDIRKLLLFLLYGSTALCYGLAFWKKIRSTPYILLIGAGGLLVFGGLVDLAHLPGEGTPAMLEDGSTLLASLNVALYFWVVCRQEIWQTLRSIRGFRV